MCFSNVNICCVVFSVFHVFALLPVFQNEGQSLNKLMPNTGNNSQTQRSMSLSLSQHRQSTASSGLGDSPISSGSSPSPAPSGQPRTTRSQSTGGFSSSMQPGIHSTPTSSCRPIRGTSLFRYVNSVRWFAFCVPFFTRLQFVEGNRAVPLWSKFF